ncbi:MAG: ribosome-associated translation inhibitor RaiA [Bradymonadales bacterium]|nr:MAG: ribosome-associated translation inhibitor RaiA [Bradymonadales bacterium]
MKLDIVFKEMESTEAIKQHIRERAEKLEPYIAPDEYVRVALEAKFKGQRHQAEIDWNCNLTKKNYHAKAEGHHLYTQIDEIFQKVLKQVHNNHKKTIDARRRSEPLKKIPAA